MIRIRQATLSDAESIATIHTNNWKENYQRSLSSHYLHNVVPEERLTSWRSRLENPKSNQRVVVAEVDQKDVIIGFACLYIEENSKWGSYVDNLHVCTDHQSKGVGKALLGEAARLASIASEDSNQGFCLLVVQENIKAQKFYQRLGGKREEESVWNAPDGSIVPTYWYVWDNLKDLTTM